MSKLAKMGMGIVIFMCHPQKKPAQGGRKTRQCLMRQASTMRHIVAGHKIGAALKLAVLHANPTNLTDVLRRLVQLRLYLYPGLLAVVVGSWKRLEISFPLLPTFVVLALALILTGQAWLRVNTRAVIGSAEFGMQLLADIVALGVLVFFSGGAYNPFISLLLLPVVMAAGVMPGTSQIHVN